MSRSRIWLHKVSQIAEREWALLPQLNVMAGVIHLEISKMFSEKVILCLLQYLLLYNNSSFQPVTHLSSLASILKENHPNSGKMDFVVFLSNDRL